MQTMIKEMNPSRLEAMRQGFRAGIVGVLGEGACHVLTSRPQGGAEVMV